MYFDYEEKEVVRVSGSSRRKVLILLGSIIVVAIVVLRHEIAACWKDLSSLQQTTVFAVGFSLVVVLLLGRLPSRRNSENRRVVRFPCP